MAEWVTECDLEDYFWSLAFSFLLFPCALLYSCQEVGSFPAWYFCPRTSQPWTDITETTSQNKSFLSETAYVRYFVPVTEQLSNTVGLIRMPLPLMCSLSTFPSTGNALCSLLMNPHLSLLCLELSPISSPHCNILTPSTKVFNRVFLTALVSVNIFFDSTPGLCLQLTTRCVESSPDPLPPATQHRPSQAGKLTATESGSSACQIRCPVSSSFCGGDRAS